MEQLLFFVIGYITEFLLIYLVHCAIDILSFFFFWIGYCASMYDESLKCVFIYPPPRKQKNPGTIEPLKLVSSQQS